MPVVVNSVYTTNNVNAGKFARSEPRSVVIAGIYSHSGGVGAVPVMALRKSCNSSRDRYRYRHVPSRAVTCPCGPRPS